MTRQSKSNLAQVELKPEDLTPQQLEAGIQLNECIQIIDEAHEIIFTVDSHDEIAKQLNIISQQYARIGTIMANFEYGYDKIIDNIDTMTVLEWKKLQDADNSAAVCNKLSELVLTPEIKKQRRIAKWCFKLSSTYYKSVEKIINSVNRRHDNVAGSFPYETNRRFT